LQLSSLNSKKIQINFRLVWLWAYGLQFAETVVMKFQKQDLVKGESEEVRN